MKIHPQVIIFQKHLIILPLTIQNQFSLLLQKRKTPSKVRERSASINPIPDFTNGFTSPDGQSSTQFMKKIKIQSFKDNILQNLCENIIEIFDTKLINFKAQCEDLVKKSRADYSKIISQPQDELKSKDRIIINF